MWKSSQFALLSLVVRLIILTIILLERLCACSILIMKYLILLFNMILCMVQLVALWSVLVRASACPMENSLSMLRAVRGVFAAMDRPLSVSKPSARLCNELPKAAPIRDRATTTEMSFWYVQMNGTIAIHLGVKKMIESRE